jgi:hypothetical protein
MSLLARRLLRTTAQNVISAITGVIVDSPGDWDTQPNRLPNIKLRAPGDRKVSVARTLPEFTTTVVLEMEVTVAGETAEEAQDALEDLGSKVEDAFFGAQPLVKLCQQFPTVQTTVKISGEGRSHFGRAHMLIECEVFEAFDPTIINPADYPALQQMGVHVDTARPFDADGTYANPPFPDAVPPAPRSTGPDGRDEGSLELDLT